MTNRNKEHKNVFGETISITEEYRTEANKENILKENQKKKKDFQKRSYNIPNKILENMDKIVYMDREIDTNTDLIIKALEMYFNLEDVRTMLKEYDIIKGGNTNN